MIHKIIHILVWLASYFLSVLYLTALTLYEYVMDMFELPFDVWESVKNDGNEVE